MLNLELPLLARHGPQTALDEQHRGKLYRTSRLGVDHDTGQSELLGMGSDNQPAQRYYRIDYP